MRGRVCLAHPCHPDPVPIQIHTVRPVARGGQGTPTVQLCANAHGSVHALLEELEAYASVSPYATVAECIRLLPREVWSRFSTAERVIAYRGWQAYGLGYIGGRYASHARMWFTDGSPKMAGVPVFADLQHAARWSRRLRRELERL